MYIITGFSGAGKSVVLKTLEDIGFFCIDNLPAPLMPSFFDFVKKSPDRQQCAVAVDIRSGHDMTEIVAHILRARDETFPIKIIFINAQAPILLKRFQETRRKHPLGNHYSLDDALERERAFLEPIRACADLVVETDQLTLHQLRHLMRSMIQTDAQGNMLVTVTSFGFKYGVPHESNFVYDVRALANPYFVPELRDYNGTHSAIQHYIFNFPESNEYWQRLSEFVRFSLEKSLSEGRHFVSVAIGCTGGKHRSVAFVERLAQLKVPQVEFLIRHRDIARGDG